MNKPLKVFDPGTLIEIHNADGNVIIPWTGFDDSDVPLRIHRSRAREIVAAVNERDALVAALKSLQYYVGNPSAWEKYDDVMSERIRKACEVAEPKFWTKKGTK